MRRPKHPNDTRRVVDSSTSYWRKRDKRSSVKLSRSNDTHKNPQKKGL